MSEQVPSDVLFSIGEIAIFWNPNSINHGKELVILSDMQWRKTIDTFTGERHEGWRYLCDMPNVEFGPHRSKHSDNTWVAPEFLRKKRPPREDLQLVRWSECPWQPQQVQA